MTYWRKTAGTLSVILAAAFVWVSPLLGIILILLGAGEGYYGGRWWRSGRGAVVGLVTILLIVMIVYLLGGIFIANHLSSPSSKAHLK